LQDSRGFIWITTSVGICRYDGYNIKTFQYDIISGLTHNMVEDNEGNIWYATVDDLSRINIHTGEYRKYRNNPADRWKKRLN